MFTCSIQSNNVFLPNVVFCETLNQLNSRGHWNNPRVCLRVNMTELSWIWRAKIILKNKIYSLLRKVMKLDAFYKTETRSRKLDWNGTLLSSFIGIAITFQKTIFIVSEHNSMSTLRWHFLELFLSWWEIKPISAMKKISKFITNCSKTFFPYEVEQLFIISQVKSATLHFSSSALLGSKNRLSLRLRIAYI